MMGNITSYIRFLFMKLTSKTGDRCSTQLAKMSIEPTFVKLTADVVRIIL